MGTAAGRGVRRSCAVRCRESDIRCALVRGGMASLLRPHPRRDQKTKEMWQRTSINSMPHFRLQTTAHRTRVVDARRVPRSRPRGSPNAAADLVCFQWRPPSPTRVSDRDRDYRPMPHLDRYEADGIAEAPEDV